MKKISILLIFLFSVQLSGCANKQPDPPVQEFSLTEENGDRYFLRRGRTVCSASQATVFDAGLVRNFF